MTFIDGPMAEIAAWAVWIAVMVAGIAALRKLVQWAIAANRWGMGRFKVRQHREAVIDDIVSTEGWPNGASSMKEALRDMYDRQTSQHAAITTLTASVDNLTGQVEQLLTENNHD